MAGAWGWYGAALRSTYHLGLRGTIVSRIMGNHLHAELRERSSHWAADPRTTPDLIRRALDDVVACGAFTPSESYMLKAEYLGVDRILNERNNPGRELIVARLRASFNSGSFQLGPGSGPGDRRCLASLAPRAGAEPSGAPAGHRQLAGL